MPRPFTLGSDRRQRSPPLGGSTLITSAPKSASSIVHNGPGYMVLRSSIRTPFSGSSIQIPPLTCLFAAAFVLRPCAECKYKICSKNIIEILFRQ